MRDFYWTPTLEWCLIGTISLWLLAANGSLVGAEAG